MGNLRSRLILFQRDLDGLLAVREHLRREQQIALVQLERLNLVVSAHEEALIVINAVTEAKRAELKSKVEDLISFALSQIFETDYRFVLRMDQRGQQVDVKFLVRDLKRGDFEVDLLDASGGGLVQVVAFLLKLLVVLSSRPPMRKVLFLDEPLRMVSAEYADNLCSFLKSLAAKTGFQFVIITHDKNLAGMGDKAYQFRLEGGVTKVRELDPVEGVQ